MAGQTDNRYQVSGYAKPGPPSTGPTLHQKKNGASAGAIQVSGFQALVYSTNSILPQLLHVTVCRPLLTLCLS